MKRIIPFFSVICFFTVFSGLPLFAQVNGITPAAFRLARAAVFEVIIEKPQEDPVAYERELNWESVPYAIRTDKYYSIGTAFAISERELFSAFHVINLGLKSMVYEKYFIRDSGGTVYEIDEITGGSSEKDFIIFTVKGKTFTDYFKLERDFEVGDSAYSIGNALGEGIVMRGGLILGTVPEEEAGRWNMLKSSADGNPGNSGGPLVNAAGSVIALVTALRDNILYSLPVGVMLDTPRDSLKMHAKYSYSHLLLANSLTKNFDASAALPDSPLALQDRLSAAYQEHYEAAMEELFTQAPPYLASKNNAHLYYSSLSSVFPEIDFIDKNDNNWKLSNLERKTYNLPGDGFILHTAISGFNFYKINKPRTAELGPYVSNPKLLMDLILQNIRTERSLWANDKYRILSFDEPYATGEYTDSLGRTWFTAHWRIAFDDKILIMYILPLPNGPAIISTMQSSARKDIYEWDLQKTCDHTHAAYSGTFGEWQAFLQQRRFIPRFLADAHFRWDESEQKIEVRSGPFAIALDNRVFDWSDMSEVFLAPTWYFSGDSPEYGIRKVILNRDSRGKEYMVLYKNIKPDALLGTNVMESWNDRVQEKFPFDGKPAISARDNAGSMGVILKTSSPNALYSLYLSVENPAGEESLSRRFEVLRGGVGIKQ